MKTTNVSPLRYPGGKTRACKILDEILQSHFDLSSFDTLVSPFLGGGSFEWYVQNKYHVWLKANDLFTPLYHFWHQVQTNKTRLCEELRKIPSVTKEQFLDYRNRILNLHMDPLTQAIYYFIINRCSFSGATLSGGFSQEASLKRYTPSSIQRIESMDLAHVELYNLDFTEFMKQDMGEKSLLFVDPPYYLEKKSKLYGNNGDLHADFPHDQLLDILKTKKNWILTYNNCEYIRTLYQSYTILDVHWSYGMNPTKPSSEIVILSIPKK